MLRAFAGSFVLPGDAPSFACLHSAGRCPRPLRPNPCPKPFETAVKSFFFVYRFDLFSVCSRIFVQVCPVILSQIFGLFCARSTKLPTPPPENSAFCLDILHGTALYLCCKETSGMKMHGYVFFCPEIRFLPVFGIVPGNVRGNVHVSASFFVWRVLQCGKM